jgi:predicted secreted Zn-dependent protease
MRTFLLWWVLIGMSALAHGKESFRIEYFEIRGATAQQLRAELKRLGPIGETGIRGDGYTEYRIAWKFSMTLKNGVCRARDVDVDLDVVMRLPRWDPPARAPKRLLDTWNQFATVLREHEDGHHRLAIAAAREVQRKLRARTSAPSCEAVKIRLNAIANDVLRKYREKQLAYDLDTDYGRAQGTNVL